MSLPEDTLALVAVPADLLPPDEGARVPLIQDYELGGVALNDSSQGLQVKNWRIRLVGNEVRISADPYASETVLFSETGITELSLAFNQNMAPNVAYVALGITKLYWYSTALGAMTTTTFSSDIYSPFLTMDDKRSVATLLNWNDVLMFYLRSDLLCYRQQRESFGTERVLQTLSGTSGFIAKVGMNKGLRVQIEIGGLA